MDAAYEHIMERVKYFQALAAPSNSNQTASVEHKVTLSEKIKSDDPK